MPNRIYLSSYLSSGNQIALAEEDVHYLTNVLRLKNSGVLRVFNEKDGEYFAEIKQISKKQCFVEIKDKIREIVKQGSLNIAMSLIKNDKFFLTLEKITELGATSIQPLICERSQYNKLNMERAFKCLKEATEQSERFEIPTLKTPINLVNLLKSSDYEDIIFCSEKAKPEDNLFNIQKDLAKNLCFVIGPEGGFSPKEFDIISGYKHVSLGNNILRAETAAFALVSQIQLLKNMDLKT